MSLADIMTAHIEQELYGEHATHSIISVRRKHLWDDSITQFLKPSFDPRKPVTVIFHGEEAADGGGPRKEYFRLLSKCIREQSGAFCGRWCCTSYQLRVGAGTRALQRLNNCVSHGS